MQNIRSKSVLGPLHGRSLKLLRDGWEIGPLAGHRGCCRASKDVISRTLIENPDLRKKMWALTSGLHRCRSNTCRPGDPFGCAITNARLNQNRSDLIIGTWLDTGHSAYLGRFEGRGAPGVSLASVMASTQFAMKRALGGGSWLSAKRRYGVVGQIVSVSVVKTCLNCWVVRRWMVLGTSNELDAPELSSLSENLYSRWNRSLLRHGAGVRSPANTFQPINRLDVAAVAQATTGCVSALDPLIESVDELLRIELAPEKSEKTATLLAEQYRSNRVALVEQFNGAGRWQRLIRVKDEFGFGSAAAGDQDFCAIEIPDTARDFAEMALGLFGVKLWSAYLNRRVVDDDEQSWNVLVGKARELKPQYVSIEIIRSGRFNKQ